MSAPEEPRNPNGDEGAPGTLPDDVAEAPAESAAPSAEAPSGADAGPQPEHPPPGDASPGAAPAASEAPAPAPGAQTERPQPAAPPPSRPTEPPSPGPAPSRPVGPAGGAADAPAGGPLAGGGRPAPDAPRPGVPRPGVPRPGAPARGAPARGAPGPRADRPAAPPPGRRPPPAVPSRGPGPTGQPRASRDRPVVDPVLEDWPGLEDWEEPPAQEELDEELLAESTPSRWVSMANLVGSTLVAVVALQVALAIIEGLSYNTNEPQGVATGDFLHRLGYPFGSLGTTALLFLVVGVVLLSLPAYFDDETTEAQERTAGIALIAAAVAAVIITLGAILAVRANFHVYSESGRSVPSYVIVQYISFLIANLGTAVVALYAAVQTRNLHTYR